MNQYEAPLAEVLGISVADVILSSVGGGVTCNDDELGEENYDKPAGQSLQTEKLV